MRGNSILASNTCNKINFVGLMMAKFLLFLFFLVRACSAGPEDLSGKVFVFPKQTNTASVKITPAAQSFPAISVCLRFISDVSRHYALFSVATPSNQNAFLLWRQAPGLPKILLNDKGDPFTKLLMEEGAWNSICATWDSVTGLGQVWLNGKPSPRKHVHPGAAVEGQPIIILGQDQDSHGGNFDAEQSFVGELTDVHMWNYVLPSDEIQNFMTGQNFKSGNAVSWRSLEYSLHGEVVKADEQTSCKK
ncbi:serum amyloid P-component-like [Megalops cyprinoides]|uniref:serum amyloid P-component-like n=1 Tax=Megalops cyprinoides TaxID=118141 RepID=UPI00186533F5|nr:serum amyloid P-component-like [Megalops cyprinoides]